MSTGNMIAAVGQVTLGLGTQLLGGIKPERFARLPEGRVGQIPTNHPAWAFGHLGLYGSRICAMLGDEDAAGRVAAPEAWDKLFGMGSTCEDDPDGGRYPEMARIAEQFQNAYEAVIATLKQTDAAVFERTNPVERMRERFPTIGIAATFMAGSHAMFHLGQVSAWRRVEGLGSAMKL